MGIEALTLANIAQMIGGTLKGKEVHCYINNLTRSTLLRFDISSMGKKTLPRVHPEAVLLTNKGWINKTGREWKLKTQEERLLSSLNILIPTKVLLTAVHQTAVVSRAL